MRPRKPRVPQPRREDQHREFRLPALPEEPSTGRHQHDEDRAWYEKAALWAFVNRRAY